MLLEILIEARLETCLETCLDSTQTCEHVSGKLSRKMQSVNEVCDGIEIEMGIEMSWRER